MCRSSFSQKCSHTFLEGVSLFPKKIATDFLSKPSTDLRINLSSCTFTKKKSEISWKIPSVFSTKTPDFVSKSRVFIGQTFPYRDLKRKMESWGGKFGWFLWRFYGKLIRFFKGILIVSYRFFSVALKLGGDGWTLLCNDALKISNSREALC